MAAEPRPEGPRRILVIANKTCPCGELQAEIARRAGRLDPEILIVAPALNSRLAHYVSDTDGAVDAARERLDTAIAALDERGVRARGEVGDSQPMQAIEDALHDFEADELLISSHPPGESHWLETNLVERARERLDLPVAHVVTGFGLGTPT
jgi:hypothetical protein